MCACVYVYTMKDERDKISYNGVPLYYMTNVLEIACVRVLSRVTVILLWLYVIRVEYV